MFDSNIEAGRIGWKQSYSVLRKKAMEQELSMSGLVVSLSIAFFIVGASAMILNAAYHSFETKGQSEQRMIDGGQLIEVGNLAHFFISPVSAATLDLKATPVKDTEYVNVPKGQSLTQTVRLKNIGKDSWKPGEVSFQTGPSLKRISRLYKSSWLKFYEPVKLPREVKSGQIVDISFPIQAPTDIEGTIQENFQLVYLERPMSGSLVRIFVTIGEAQAAPVAASPPAPATSTPSIPVPITPAAPTTSPIVQQITNEPIIRVGLFNSTAIQRISYSSSFDVYSGSDILFSSVPAAGIVSASFDPASRRYVATFSNASRVAAAPLRFIPRDLNGIATLLDYKSDNRFRGTIEMRYTEPAKKIWLINELPIESYLKGLAETSSASPVEFQKIMATAARTYAMYHYERGKSFGLPTASTKHASDHFHIDAYYDQVYRGYNSELRLPRLSAAVDATRGVVVTYAGKIVVTPYFSNSDGRTRDWTEVWGGAAVPWLKSVAVPQDTGKTLYGHGVGMSARAALLMVVDGTPWEEVLKYFYTGIILAKNH